MKKPSKKEKRKIYNSYFNIICIHIHRWEVRGSIPGRACRPSRSGFSVVFSEIHVNAVYDPLERHSRRASYIYSPRTLV